MELFRKVGLAGFVAVLCFVSGLATPYRDVHAQSAPASAPATASISATEASPAAVSVSAQRLGGAAEHLERLTRELRGRTDRAGAPSGESALATARRLRPHLAALRSLDLILAQAATEERSDMRRLRADSEQRERFDADDARIRRGAASYRAIAERLERALAANSENEADAALDALAVELGKGDVTRRQDFDPRTLRAQQVQREDRAPATTRAQLDAFLATTAAPAAAPMMAAAAVVQPELAETDETRITPRIRALAEQLQGNPVMIFNWVRNHIDYVPTHGAIQGADLTLVNRRGNAADTNSLLAALLRASGVPTRFVYGTVDVPVDQAVNWLKAKAVSDAVGQLQVGGIPSTIMKSNGQVVALRMQHLWIEAFIDFTPSRGVVNREPDAWIPMDASFKQFTRTASIDVLGLGDWNPADAAQSLLQGAQIGTDGSITRLNTHAYQGQVDAAIGRIAASPEYGSIRDPQLWLGEYRIVASQLPVISGTLPFAISAATARFAAVPDSLKYFVKVELFANPQDIAYENPSVSLRLPTVRLGGQSLFVHYKPATAADELALKTYEASNAASLPLSSFKVVPQIKLGEEVLAEGSVVGMGTQQYWQAGIVDLQGHMDGTFEPYQFAAGSHISFTPDLGGTSAELLGHHFDGLPDSSSQPIAKALHLAGVQYWYLNDSRASLYARGWGGHFLRMPSLGVFAAPLQVRYFFGIPRTGSYAGFATDIKADRVALYHDDPAKQLRMTFQVGTNGSLSESTTWDLLFNNRAGNSLSAASIIGWANRSGVPIHTITAENVDQILPKLQTTADVKTEIRNAAMAGLHVVVPEREFAQGRIAAAGYVMLDPNTGGGIYRVDGGLNGALNVGCIAKAVLLKAVCESKFARLMAARLAQLAARFAVRIGLAAVMAAVAPPLAIILPVVSAVLLAVTIIQVTYEVLTWVREVMNGTISLTPEEMAEAGIRAVNEYACNYLPTCFNNPMGQLGNMGFGGGPDLGSAGPGGPPVGNPVSPGDGVKTEAEVDYTGTGPFPLSYVRTYMSYLPNGSPVGHKWSASYHQRLRLPDGATAMEAPDAVLAQRRDGGWQQFVMRSGVYAGNGDVPERIERVTDGLGRTTQWRLRTAEDLVEIYSADGLLQAIENRSGLRQTLTYSSDGLLERVTDPFGRSLSFEYDATTRQVVAMTDPEQRRTRYSYDAGALTSVDYPDSTRRQYHYETPGWPTLLTGITDGRGVRYASWKYDDESRVIESTHADGAERVTLAYGDKQTTVTDARNTTRTYRFTRVFDTLRMTEVTEPCAACGSGSAARIDYDGAGQPALLTDHNGNKTQVRINSRGLPEQWTKAFGTTDAQTVSIRWHASWRLPELVTETGATGTTKQTLLEYDGAGNPSRRTVSVDGQSRVWTYDYNDAGQLVSEDGPRTDVADVTTFEYDPATGNRTLMRDPNGLVTRYTLHDANGRVLRMIDPNGLVTDYRYDGRDRVIESKVAAPGAAAEVTTFAYTGFGALERMTLPDGSWLQYEYDGAQRAAGLRDSLGNRIVYTLNAAGDLEREEVFDPDGRRVNITHQTFDNLGLLTKAYGSRESEATSFTYDGNGNQRTSWDPLRDSPDERRYDALDRLMATVDSLGGQVGYRYDTQDNLRRLTDARGLSTQYDYNGFNELVRQVSPDTGTTSFTYDAAGNPVTKRDARDVNATYRHDAANRLLSVQYPDETIAFAYDEISGGEGGKGRLTRITDGSGTTGFVYDAQGRVVQKVQQLGPDSYAAGRKSLAHSYAQGRLHETVLPSGARVGYGYGADGRPNRVTVNGQVVASGIEYFPYGQPSAWDGVAGRYQRTFDADGRIDGYQLGSRGTSVGYDAASRVAVLAGTTQDRPQWRLDYDGLDRLKAAHNSGGGAMADLGLGWTFDASGNRTSETRTGRNPATVAFGIDPASNRLLSVDGDVRTYDASGNSIGRNGQSLVYSARGRLVEVRVGSQVLVRHAYNARGERVCSTAGGMCPTGTSTGSGYQQYVYDQDGHLVGEYNSAGELVAEHVWLGDTPVAVLKPAADAVRFGGLVAGNVSVYAIEPDHLDTPRSIVNGSSVEVWRWDSDPFGRGDPNANPSTLGNFEYRLRMPGQQYDPVSGTHYNFFRDYDPQVARYLESDPLGLDDGPNTYDYAGGDPLGQTDIDGLKRSGKKRMHGNCSDFRGDCHVYMVMGPGGIYKIGESCAGYNSQGLSKRCERQANRLTAETGRRYTCKIVYRGDTKGEVRDEETKRIKRARKCGCSLLGNKGNH